MFKCIRLVAGVCAIGAVLCFTAGNAWAADRTWDGGGTGDDWTTPGNWSDDTVPGGGDTAYINTTAAGTPEINSTVTNIKLFTLADGALDLGNLHIKNSGSLTTTAGTCYVGNLGAGALTIEDGGSLTTASYLEVGYSGSSADGDVIQNGGTDLKVGSSR